MKPEDIIIAPVITEKSNDELQAGKYTFRVNKKATKIDIRNAVEKLFEVKVLNVNTISVKGKEVRRGKTTGKNKEWKKENEPINKNQGIIKYLDNVGKEFKFYKKIKHSIEHFMGA